MTGENAVKTMQTRLSPGAEREQGARVVGAFVFRFYIQVDFIYRAQKQRQKNDLSLSAESRVCSVDFDRPPTVRHATPPSSLLQKTATHVHDELN